MLQDREDGVYLLPAATQFETVVLSQHQTGLYNGVIKWLNHCLNQNLITGSWHVLQKSLDFMTDFPNISMDEGDEPNIEDITREFNRGMWTIGYTGQSPERIKCTWPTSTHLIAQRCARLVGRQTGTPTGCRGHVGAHPR